MLIYKMNESALMNFIYNYSLPSIHSFGWNNLFPLHLTHFFVHFYCNLDTSLWTISREDITNRCFNIFETARCWCTHCPVYYTKSRYSMSRLKEKRSTILVPEIDLIQKYCTLLLFTTIEIYRAQYTNRSNVTWRQTLTDWLVVMETIHLWKMKHETW